MAFEGEEEQYLLDTQIPFTDIHVMVVDDDITTLAIIAAMLKSWRYGVVTVNNPMEALETLSKKRGSIDLVLTDLHMPRMNGFELQKHVKQEFQLPVIVMSIDNRKSVVSKILGSGATFYLSKPLSLNDLKNLWQYAIAGKKDKCFFEEFAPNYLQSLEDLSGGYVHSAEASIANEENEKNKYNKRKGLEMIKGDQYEGTSMASKKKTKIVWSNSLHKRFLMAIRHIGFERAVPKKIVELMNVPGLTREHVASHLQKYRIFLKKVAEIGTLEGLSERVLRSTFASELSHLFLRNLQKKIPNLEHQLRTMFRSRYGSRNAAPSNAAPNSASNQVPCQYPSLEASRTNSLQPRIPYGQPSIAPYNVLAHLQNQEASKRNQLGFGQSRLLTGKANFFQSPVLGYRNNLHQGNQAHFAGSNFPTYGLVNARNGLAGGSNRTEMYPQQTQTNLGGQSSGSKLPLNTVYYPSSNYAGNQVNNRTALARTGQAGLNNNIGVQNVSNNGYGLINGFQIGNSSHTVQGGSSSFAAIQSTFHQFPPALHKVNQQENISRLPPVAQTQHVPEKAGGGQDSTITLVNDASTFNKDRSLDLVELFLLHDSNNPDSEQQSGQILNPGSFIVPNQTEVNCPTDELLKSSLESSYNVEQSHSQETALVMETVTGKNMNLPNEFPSFSIQDYDQQQGNEELMDSEPLGINTMGNAASSSGNNPSSDLEFDMELLEALFGTEANLKE